MILDMSNAMTISKLYGNPRRFEKTAAVRLGGSAINSCHPGVRRYRSGRGRESTYGFNVHKVAYRQIANARHWRRGKQAALHVQRYLYIHREPHARQRQIPLSDSLMKNIESTRIMDVSICAEKN